MSSIDLPDWVPGNTPGGSTAFDGSIGPVTSGSEGSSPYIEVFPYTQLIINVRVPTTAACEVFLQWFADPLGVIPLQAQQSFFKLGSAQTFIRVPVIGPYLQISVNNNGGFTQSFPVVVSGTTCPFPVGVDQALGLWCPLDAQAQAIPGNSQAEFYPAVAVAGPAMLSIMGTISFSWRFERANNGAWDILFGDFNTDVGPIYVPCTLPGDDWRVRVVNPNAGAGSYYISVTLDQQ